MSEKPWASERLTRTSRLTVRFTPAERARVDELARESGAGRPSSYIRSLLAREDEAANERNPK